MRTLLVVELLSTDWWWCFRPERDRISRFSEYDKGENSLWMDYLLLTGDVLGVAENVIKVL